MDNINLDKYIKCYSKRDYKKLEKLGFILQQENNGIYTFEFNEFLYQNNKNLFNNSKRYKITTTVEFGGIFECGIK